MKEVVIFSFILERGIEELKKYLLSFKEVTDENKVVISSYTTLESKVCGMAHFFEGALLHNIEKPIDELSKDEIQQYYYFFTERLPSLKREFQLLLKDFICIEEDYNRFSKTEYKKANLYTFFMQKIGNNIRSSGNPYSEEYSGENYYHVANRINYIIQVIRKYNELNEIRETRICIDAVRNPYEAFFFKDIYSSFYLVSVNTEEEERKRRLGYLDSEELRSLDETESPPGLKNDRYFFHQNIPGCLEISDIHLYNPNTKTEKRYFLTEQIIKYLSLMIHPGLVTPTNIERCMQLACNAKLNSGCLSRQVGAIICDQNYSVKAVGWNDVPAGQIPCNLRDTCMYCVNMERETHSTFEIENKEFTECIHALNSKVKQSALRGRFFPYCFKDVYEGITGAKNQVHTRSLHAEENAFLQLSKYGGQGIEGGILFTSASPCELCSKKAYQLGIRDIYYIDPYPGISFSHILSFGKYNNPKLHLFHGAIGNAYVALYTQRISVKDELELMTGLSGKNVKSYIESSEYVIPDIKDYQFLFRKTVFTFESREKIWSSEKTQYKALHNNLSSIPDIIYWTGSSFDGIQMKSYEREAEKKCTYAQLPDRSNPYVGILRFDPPLNEGETCTVEKRIDVKDSAHIMFPYYAQPIMYKTEHTEIEVRAIPGLLKDVKIVTYADIEMDKKWIISDEPLRMEKVIENSVEYESYKYSIENPVIKYSYCIEWNFA